MYRQYSTASVPKNHEFGYWREVIAETYFNLQLQFSQTEHFSARLQCWTFGDLSLSRLESSGLSYRRLRQECQAKDSQLLVTMPLLSASEFYQLGREVKCEPGQFFLEHSDEPYEFLHRDTNDMWVLKLSEKALSPRISAPHRFCAMKFDAMTGVGKLFRNYLSLISADCVDCPVSDHAHLLPLVGEHLLELLALVLEGDRRVLQSQSSVIQDAHLARIESYVRVHLNECDLSPEKVASACDISVRYLHQLFKVREHTFSQWVRELRLECAYARLIQPGSKASIAQIAYQFGFSDQAQFSHAFRRKFLCAPRSIKASIPASSDDSTPNWF